MKEYILNDIELAIKHIECQGRIDPSENLISQPHLKEIKYRIGSLDNIILFNRLYPIYLNLCDELTVKELIPNHKYMIKFSSHNTRHMICLEKVGGTEYLMKINDSGAFGYNDNKTTIDIKEALYIKDLK
jgi:hypothetical protein